MAGHPIFILGITPRAGTNYVWRLLGLHPDCVLSSVPEDYTLAHAEHLFEYSEAIAREIRREPAQRRAQLTRMLGESVIGFLNGGAPQKRLIAKTPSVRNLDRFSELFPDAYVVVLIRDGRDVLESGMRSFDWSFDRWARVWAQAARTVAAFSRAGHAAAGRSVIIKYEDLLEDVRSTLEHVLVQLQLDPSRYDFAAASALPVFGSSELRSRGEGEVHWRPWPKPTGFSPVHRWKWWGWVQRSRFDWIAGAELRLLGYAPDPARVARPLSVGTNVVLDVNASLRAVGRRALKRLTRPGRYTNAARRKSPSSNWPVE